MQVKEVFSPQEIKTVEKLAFEIWNEYYPSIIGQEQVDYMLAHFQRAQFIIEQMRDSYHYFLLFEDETPIGYISVQRQEYALFLSKLYIKKDARQKGYAKEAIEFVKRFALIHELSHISLTVNKHNAIAILAYERLGFKKRGSLVQDIGEGFKMDDFCFELSAEREERP